MDEEAQNSPTVITVDSPERASDALPALEGAAQEAHREACASLENGVLTGGPPNADRVVGETPLEIATKLSFSTRLANADPRRPRGPDRLVLNSPVIPMKWEQPSMGALVLILPTKSLISSAPSTKGILMSLTCATSSPPAIAYRWWSFQKSTLSPSPVIWTKSPTSAWPRIKCTCATIISTRRQSLYVLTSFFFFLNANSYVVIFFSNASSFAGCHSLLKYGTPA